MVMVLDVLYSQFSVFDANLEVPFNDWTDQHVKQGFSWRDGSVSFLTLDTDGPLEIDVKPVDSTVGGERVIAVPFKVPEHGRIEIATINQAAAVDMRAGDYRLLFRHGRRANGVMWAALEFAPVLVPIQPMILVADARLTPGTQLVMSANPA